MNETDSSGPPQPHDPRPPQQNPAGEPAPERVEPTPFSEQVLSEQAPSKDGTSSPAEPGKPAPDGQRGVWEAERERLRSRFPDTKEGVLFCVHKLEQNRDTRLADFRDEAALYGVPMSGRSMHSAKVLLGMAEKSARRTPSSRDSPSRDSAAPRAADVRRAPAGAGGTSSLEQQLTSALQQIQGAATQQSQKLRDAMQEAIRVMQRALDQS